MNFVTGHPAKHSKLIRLQINSIELSEVYKYPLGSNLCCDTGWKMPLFAKKNNIKYDYISSTTTIIVDQIRKLPFMQKKKMQEWTYNDKTFVLHFGSASRHSILGTELYNCTKSFIDFCKEYFKKDII